MPARGGTKQASHERLDPENFDIKRDFDEVTLTASQPSILAVHPSVPASSVKELITLAKSQPGKLGFASAGPGRATHLGTELLQHAVGISMLHVPYKSAGQATSAVLSGEVQVLLTNMASMLPFVKSGKIKALGVSSLQRSSLAPELPTVAEAGIPGFEYVTWYGMVVPAGVPKSIISRIQADTAKAIGKAQVRERFAGQGLTVYGTSAADFGIYLQAEIEKWHKLVRVAGVRVE